jgi:hypothetical protein
MNHYTNEWVLMYDDFRIMCTSDPGGKPSANYVFLTSLNIRAGENFSAALQHAVTVMFSLFSPDVKT